MMKFSRFTRLIHEVLAFGHHDQRRHAKKHNQKRQHGRKHQGGHGKAKVGEPGVMLN